MFNDIFVQTLHRKLTKMEGQTPAEPSDPFQFTMWNALFLATLASASATERHRSRVPLLNSW